jgi:hypothetical protein
MAKGLEGNARQVRRRRRFINTFKRDLAAAEESLARPVSPNLMTRAEWRRKQAEAGSFAALPKVFVIGAEDDLG